MSDVFISYSRVNKLFADRLTIELEKNNRSVWIDREDIQLTAEWWQEIQRGIETSDNFILIMSPASLGSPVCHLEIEHARNLTKRIIPVYHIENDYQTAKEYFGKRLYEGDKDGFLLRLYGDHNPLLVFEDNWAILPGLNRVDALNIITAADGTPPKLNESLFLQFFAVLRQAIDTDIVYVHQHTRLFARAQDWDKSNRKISFLLNGDETVEAEEWLYDWERDTAERKTKNLSPKNPQPDPIMRDFIESSRSAENRRIAQAQAQVRRTRMLIMASVLLIVSLITASIVGANAVAQANRAGIQAADAQNAANTAALEMGHAQNGAATAGAIQMTAQQDASIAQAQVATANVILTSVPPTVTALAAAVIDAQEGNTITTQLADALLRVREGSWDAALKAVNSLVERYPQKALAYFSRGLIYDVMNRPADALTNYDRAITLDPKFARVYMNRGLIYTTLGHYDYALDDYNKSVDLDPTFARTFNNRGAAYLYLQQYDKALADFSQVISLDSRYTQAYINRGSTYRILKQHDQAIADFSKALELNPTSSLVYSYRGSSYKDLKKYDEAIADFNKAIELNPRNATFYGYRGNTYNDLKEYDKAIVDLSKAIELNGTYAAAYNYRGIAYYYLTQYTEALADWQIFTSLGEKLTPEVEQYRTKAEAILKLTGTPTITATATP